MSLRVARRLTRNLLTAAVLTSLCACTAPLAAQPSPSRAPFVLAACTIERGQPIRVANSSRPEQLCDLELTLDATRPPAHVWVDAVVVDGVQTETLRVGTDLLTPVAIQEARFDQRGGGDVFKQVAAVPAMGGVAHLAYSILHCPADCFTADVAVLALVDGSLHTVFQTNAFTGAASISADPGGELVVDDAVFQAGDMCCPTGLSRTVYTWDGSTYERDPR